MMQEYMSDKNKNLEDIGFIFALRTRTVQGIRKDFEGMFPNVIWPLCHFMKTQNKISQNARNLGQSL